MKLASHQAPAVSVYQGVFWVFPRQGQRYGVLWLSVCCSIRPATRFAPCRDTAYCQSATVLRVASPRRRHSVP